MRKLGIILVLAAACNSPAAPERVVQSQAADPQPEEISAVPDFPVTSTTEPEPTTIPELTIPAPPPTTTTVPAPAPRPTVTTRPSRVDVDYGEWAIPRYIVECESEFDWYAYNPSSQASGPYQMVPLHFGGELAMNQSRAAQHAKAAQLWNGGAGRHHWAECL